MRFATQLPVRCKCRSRSAVESYILRVLRRWSRPPVWTWICAISAIPRSQWWWKQWSVRRLESSWALRFSFQRLLFAEKWCGGGGSKPPPYIMVFTIKYAFVPTTKRQRRNIPLRYHSHSGKFRHSNSRYRAKPGAAYFPFGARLGFSIRLFLVFWYWSLGIS